MGANLRPLEEAALERVNGWLPKLSHPVRIGEHDQTSFALGLILDYAAPPATRNLPTCWHRKPGSSISETRIVRWHMNPPARTFFRRVSAKLSLSRGGARSFMRLGMGSRH
jgi:hypothetical protein